MARDPKYRVKDFAERFDVHEKTILRAVTGNPHVSDWDPDPLPISAVAKAFSMSEVLLLKIMDAQESLLDTEGAARMLGISLRSFHERRAKTKEPQPVAQHGRTVRYLLSAITDLSGL